MTTLIWVHYVVPSSKWSCNSLNAPGQGLRGVSRTYGNTSRLQGSGLIKMKLITEEVTNVKIITEGKGAGKKLYIEGVFLQGDIKNRNGRMYPYGDSCQRGRSL